MILILSLLSRDSQFKTKGISMSVFTDDDVQALAAGGNENSNNHLLARIGDYSLPNGNDVNKLKEFIRLKYVDKKWAPGSERHNNNNNNNSNNVNFSSSSRDHVPTSNHQQSNSFAGFDSSHDNSDPFGDNNSSNNDSGSHRRSSTTGAPIVIPKSLVKTAVSNLFCLFFFVELMSY